MKICKCGHFEWKHYVGEGVNPLWKNRCTVCSWIQCTGYEENTTFNKEVN